MENKCKYGRNFGFNPLKIEFILNNIQKSTLYLTGKAILLRYKAQLLDAV
jgi:hypothetical protein